MTNIEYKIIKAGKHAEEINSDTTEQVKKLKTYIEVIQPMNTLS
jgi:hypothetical protein